VLVDDMDAVWEAALMPPPKEPSTAPSAEDA